MKIIEKKYIENAFGDNVLVYDGDVNYIKTKVWKNFAYYLDEDGKKWKTRPYAQWTAMKSRLSPSHQKNFKDYIGVSICDEFLDYDVWKNWAETKSGFMCTDENGNLFQQDKDIKSTDRVYSRENCSFVPPYINSLFSTIDNSTQTMRSTMLRFLEEDFETLDEDIIGKITQKYSFDYTILSVKKFTKSEWDEYMAFCRETIKFTNPVDTSLQTGIYFKDGLFYSEYYLYGKKEKAKFKDNRDAVLWRLSHLRNDFEKFLNKEKTQMMIEHPNMELCKKRFAELDELILRLANNCESIRRYLVKYERVDY